MNGSNLMRCHFVCWGDLNFFPSTNAKSLECSQIRYSCGQIFKEKKTISLNSPSPWVYAFLQVAIIQNITPRINSERRYWPSTFRNCHCDSLKLSNAELFATLNEYHSQSEIARNIAKMRSEEKYMRFPLLASFFSRCLLDHWEREKIASTECSSISGEIEIHTRINMYGVVICHRLI